MAEDRKVSIEDNGAGLSDADSAEMNGSGMQLGRQAMPEMGLVSVGVHMVGAQGIRLLLGMVILMIGIGKRMGDRMGKRSRSRLDNRLVVMLDLV